MTREERINLLNKLLEIEEKNDIGNLTMAERGEFQQWVETLKQEPRTGEWIFVGEENEEETRNGNFRYICSECGYSDIHAKSTYVPYCWHCGAKMAEQEET